MLILVVLLRHDIEDRCLFWPLSWSSIYWHFPLIGPCICWLFIYHYPNSSVRFTPLTTPLIWTGVSGNSSSRPFPRMKASDSRSRITGMDLLIPFPFPNHGNGIFSFPSHFWIVVMDFFIPFPFPNLPFHRRESKRELEYCERYQTSNIFGFLYIFYNNLYWGGRMSQGVFFILFCFFSIPVPVPWYSREWWPLIPVPEILEWILFIPFPFLNFGNAFFSFPSLSWILGMFFSFPSRSRTLGMFFSIPFPFPNLRERKYPFLYPFLNAQKSFLLTRGFEWPPFGSLEGDVWIYSD